ncbi:MAG: metallophosphoesterase family protein [Alphaproteobacteria bacterium]|nr:metallophosphoesterase family protein [Alphaproteobacteria bacterium]
MTEWPGDKATGRVRKRWLHQRQRLEGLAALSTPVGMRYWPKKSPLEIFLRSSRPLLRATGILAAFTAHSLRVQRIDLCVTSPKLPKAFDGYRLLHLTDMHLDGNDHLAEAIAAAVAGTAPDLCVLTGDYGGEEHKHTNIVRQRLALILKAAAPHDGFVAVLGNHDEHTFAKHLHDLGVRPLINERLAVKRGDDAIWLTGLDDVSRFFTPAARKAMAAPVDGFAIALVHSPEIADVAAASGHALYLCGHTHGGQVCLPGGAALFKRLSLFRGYFRGVWRHHDLVGYTSQGAGFSVLPLRTFTTPEITVITLKCGEASVTAGERR